MSSGSPLQIIVLRRDAPPDGLFSDAYERFSRFYRRRIGEHVVSASKVCEDVFFVAGFQMGQRPADRNFQPFTDMENIPPRVAMCRNATLNEKVNDSRFNKIMIQHGREEINSINSRK